MQPESSYLFINSFFKKIAILTTGFKINLQWLKFYLFYSTY